MEIIGSRSEALRVGEKYYLTGKPCKYGHIDLRLASNGNCVPCKRDYDKLYHVEHSSVIIQRASNWADANPEKVRENKARSRMKNRERRNSQQREQYANDPRARLDRVMGKAIWKMLKTGKGGRSWKILVDFSLDELVAHLEPQFRDAMTWDNYGPHWHVDHIYPKSKCSFEEAWRLENLQPLLVEENLRKGSRIEFE